MEDAGRKAESLRVAYFLGDGGAAVDVDDAWNLEDESKDEGRSTSGVEGGGTGGPTGAGTEARRRMAEERPIGASNCCH